jgi:hypothetical protein
MATYKTGDRVTQAKYGSGTVTGSDDHHTVIDFDDHGVRTFATSLVVLQRSATPAPVRAAKSKRRVKAQAPEA